MLLLVPTCQTGGGKAAAPRNEPQPQPTRAVVEQPPAQPLSSATAAPSPVMPAPVETLTKEPPPAELVDDSACQADDDCVLAYEPCGYHRNPCRDSWKRAINREANRQWEEAWQYRKPDCSAVASCEVPSGKWLGTEARCIDGQCKAR